MEDKLLLDTVACDRARLARDARFDGKFFIGVLTTGVYCRPICPVNPARSENVLFFPTAAAAERAGFRPCLRCRPETAPGTPIWQGPAAAVSRAVELINRGFLDQRSVDDLSSAVGVGTRQLTRLFTKHIGASPTTVARTRRVQIAKRLLDETDMPVTEIAFAAGFQSIRRFNAVFKETYGRPPAHIRRSNLEPFTGRSQITIRLAYRPPFNWPLLAGFLAMEATPGVENVSHGGYRRTISTPGGGGWFSLQPIMGQNAVVVSIHTPDLSNIRQIIERVSVICDLHADPSQISAQLGEDPAVSRSLELARGVRIPGAWDGFEVAVRAVIAREAAAFDPRNLMAEIARTYGEQLTVYEDGQPHILFPTPASLADSDLSRVGVGDLAAKRVKLLARSVVAGQVAFAPTASFSDIVSRLKTIVGLDVPTAHWVAMRTLGEPDAVPFGAPLVPELGSRAVATVADHDRWRPWRSYAAVLLAAANHPALRRLAVGA